MALGVRLIQVGNGQAQIPLGGSQGLMPQQILNMPQAGMVLHKMGRARVPPHARCDGLPNLG